LAQNKLVNNLGSILHLIERLEGIQIHLFPVPIVNDELGLQAIYFKKGRNNNEVVANINYQLHKVFTISIKVLEVSKICINKHLQSKKKFFLAEINIKRLIIG